MTEPPPDQPSWPPPPQQPQQPPWQQQQPWQQQAPQPGYGYPAHGPGSQPSRPTSGKANTVMILGIIAIATFFTFCGLGVFAAIAALVMAPGARREIEASGGQLDGEGKIRTGIILSWITVGLAVLAIVVVVAVVAIARTSSQGTSEVSSALVGGRVFTLG